MRSITGWTLLLLIWAWAGLAAAQGLRIVELRVGGEVVTGEHEFRAWLPPRGEAARLKLAREARLEVGVEIEVPLRTVLVLESAANSRLELAPGTRFRANAIGPRGEWYALLAGRVAIHVRQSLDFFNVDFARFVARVRGTEFTLDTGTDNITDTAAPATATVQRGEVVILREVPTQLGELATVPMLATDRLRASAVEVPARLVLPQSEAVRRYGTPADAITAYEADLERAQRSNDADAEYAALNNLALTQIVLGQLESARARLERLLALAGPLGDLPWSARALNNLAAVHMRSQRWTEARSTLEAALNINRSLAPPAGARRLAQNLGNLAIVLRHLGQRDAARDAAEQSLAAYRHLPGENAAGMASNLETLGHLEAVGSGAAIDHHQQALALRRQVHGDRPHPETASSHLNLGSSLCAAARLDEAFVQLDAAGAMRLALRVPPPDAELARTYEAQAACWARAAAAGRAGAQARAVELLRQAREERAPKRP